VTKDVCGNEQNSIFGVVGEWKDGDNDGGANVFMWLCNYERMWERENRSMWKNTNDNMSKGG
jgi:hypothetical protein